MGFPQLVTRKPFKLREPLALTLTADAGSYTYTGTDQTLRSAYKVVPDAGSYSTTGSTATLAKGAITMAADAGSYTYTGSDVTFTYAVIAVPLSFTDIKRRNYPRAFHPSLAKPMRFAVPHVEYTLSVDSGSYATTGTDVAFSLDYVVAATTSSYALTGSDVTLTYSEIEIAQALSQTDWNWRQNYPRAFHPSLRKPIKFSQLVAQTYAIIANPGDYVIGGEAAALNAGTPQVSQRAKRSPSTWPRQFAPSYGQLRTLSLRRPAVGLNPVTSYLIAASTTAYSYTGVSASTRVSHVLTASSGSYSITGTAATITKGLLQAASGSYSITGTATSLEISYKLAIGAGSYTTTGSSASVNRAYHVNAASGSYSITGEDTGDTSQIRSLTANAGTYSLTGTAITIITDATIPIGTTFDEPVSITTTITEAVKIKTQFAEAVNI